MALDIYVGSLTRYYTGEWENISERTAREHGAPDRLARLAAEADRDAADDIHHGVRVWRATLNKSLGDRVAQPLDWDEAAETWFTGRPGWDGFGSLVLWAAYAEHPAVRRPTSLPEEWDDDPVLVRSNAASFRSRYSHLVRNVELWLPGPFDFTFEGEDVDGRRLVVGSTATLRRQLEELNGATWKAGTDLVAAWGRDALSADAVLEQNARYAFAVLLELVQRAVQYRLPMKLDY